MPVQLEIPGVCDAFLRAARAERDLSAHTLDAYRRDLEQFTSWAGGRGITRLPQIDRALLRSYVAWLAHKDYARRSIARKVSAVRALLTWAVLHDLLSDNPAADVKAPKLDRPLPRVLKAKQA
ncbi:MAG TPA: site-specific integrase, partial [Actinomycetota bacterium]|nr:site-specific integrase [Actinomycetota bacterium]